MIMVLALFVAGCAGSQQTTTDQQTVEQQASNKLPSQLDRLVPNPITNEIPTSFFDAVANGTRTMSGKPGNSYWTQWTKYDIDAELITEDTLLKGRSTITYYNSSPDTLPRVHLELSQNLHSKTSVRNEQVEITGGIHLEKLSVDGKNIKINPKENRNGMTINGRLITGYLTEGTLLTIAPEESVTPGDSIKINIDWNFKIPRRGASGRMGYSSDNLFYIAYWYPQMRVYDDVNGWFTDPFTGNAEFYHDFGNYNVDITVPEQWMVGATGKLGNGKEILKNEIYQRLNKAHQSDSVVSVVTEDDFGDVTQATNSGTVTWNFNAHNVRDFAFSVTKESRWDATRANIGDRDGDGKDDYSSINAIYRSSAPLWTNGAKFTSHALSFLSEYTGLSYPWPHMTSVEGGGIIGGGMEFPMMTIIGSYNGQPAQSLYAVIAHELAHMWVPMQISTNERRYAWMDEGSTTFSEDQSKKAYYPNGADFDMQTYQSYLQIAGNDAEGPIMRWSDYHYNSYAYYIASYPKPAALFNTLRNLLGEETFNEAYRTFLDRWQYKHPYPWDMFNTFEDVSGRNLDWFWRAWYYETWTLDQAVGKVASDGNSTTVVIEDHGQVPMPATVEITLADGSVVTREIAVETWLKGATRTVITINGQATKVVIDPDKQFTDVNRKNNTWQK